MAYDVGGIIPITERISPAGSGYANFAEAMLFAPESELPAGFAVDTYREYSKLVDLDVDFPSTTEVYKAANRWLGGIPASRKLKVWASADADLNWTDTQNKARNVLWWFWSFFTAPVYASIPDVELIAAWSETNKTYFMNCQVGTNTGVIRNPNLNTDIASTLTTSGYRFSSTFTHATDPYIGIGLCKWFAAVNYSSTNSTITGEYKKIAGAAAENLTGTEQSAMLQPTKKAMWYATVELNGSVDIGRCINTWSHSSYGEFMNDVVDLSAFANRLSVDLYNAIANPTTKVGQDPIGQALLIGTAKATCQQFISNGYLGPRDYLDPDDGIEKYTIGYEILTKPEDILGLSDPDRDARLSAPLRIRLFRKGAIHKVPVDLDVY